MATLAACTPADQAVLEGRLTGQAGKPLLLTFAPLHYKYAPSTPETIRVDADGRFVLTRNTTTNRVGWLRLGADAVPVVFVPGRTTRVNLDATRFVSGADYGGPYADILERFDEYLTQDEHLMVRIRNLRSDFREGRTAESLELLHMRAQLAMDHFGDTPLRTLVHRRMGEHLIRRLEALRYRTDLDRAAADRERALVIRQALEAGFFTVEGLSAQRAGIRDFTDAYVKSFGIEDSLEQVMGSDLSESDWKRLAHARLDSLRMQVVGRIPDEDARAHARFFLSIERLNDAPFAYADSLAAIYLADYPEPDPRTDLIRNLRARFAAVQPGSPMIPFSLPDSTGRMFTDADFRGKYLLLDFWAGWCVPCLDQMPATERLARKFRNDLTVVSISTEEDRQTWLDFMRANPHGWVNLYAGQGFEHPLFQQWMAGGIPFYVLVGRDGTILRYNDIRPNFNLEDVLEAYLAAE